MTIEELLEAAREYTRLAIVEGANVGASHEIRALFAQLAQAAAQTAQAMILNERGTLTIERIGEYVKATVGLVNVPAESEL